MQQRRMKVRERFEQLERRRTARIEYYWAIIEHQYLD